MINFVGKHPHLRFSSYFSFFIIFMNIKFRSSAFNIMTIKQKLFKHLFGANGTVGQKAAEIS